MRARRKCLAKRLPSLCLPLPLFLLASTASAFTNDFSKYPTGSQQCLNNAANASGCNGDTVEQMNSCLCGNGGNFVLAAAACISQTDSSDLETVYTTMAGACNYSGTPLSVSQKDFMNAGNASASTIPTSTSGQSTAVSTAVTTGVTTMTTVSNGLTVTVTSTASAGTGTADADADADTGGDSSGGLSNTAKIGIIAGASAVGVAILAVAVFFIVRHRKSRNRTPKDESHPMLPPKYGPPTDASYHNSMTDRTSAYNGSQEWRNDAAETKWQPGPEQWSAATTPHPQQQQPQQQQQHWDAGQYHSNWGTPHPHPQLQPQLQPQQGAWGYNPGAPYAPPYAPAPTQGAPIQPGVVELPDVEPPQPVEMPASPLQHAGVPQHQHPAPGWTAYRS